MKTNIIFLFAVIVGFVSCNNIQSNTSEETINTDIVQNPVTASGDYSTDGLPKIDFEKKLHDFGIIIQGEKVAYSFKFKNNGGSNLVVKSAKGSCGCTVPRYPKEPIKPGEESEVEIIFNSDKRSGNQHKTITLFTNAQPNKTVLTITGQVVVPN